jgi:hypothetical protein
MQSARAFSLVYFFFNICGPIIVPAIIATRSGPEYMIEHGLRICSNVSNASLRNGQVDDFTASAFMTELACLGTFVQVLITLPPLLTRDLHLGIGQRAFDFTTRVISTMESPIIPQSHMRLHSPMLEKYAAYACMLYTIVPEQMTISRAHVHPAIRAEMDRFIAAASLEPAKSAWGFMHSAKKLQYCFAPGCPESVSPIVWPGLYAMQWLPHRCVFEQRMPETRLDGCGNPTQGYLQENEAGV